VLQQLSKTALILGVLVCE